MRQKMKSLIIVLLLLFFAKDIYPYNINMVKDLNTSGPGRSSSPTNIKAIGNIAYFAADDGVHGSELWITNATNEGTKLLKDLNPGGGGSARGRFTPFGSYVYFITLPYP